MKKSPGQKDALRLLGARDAFEANRAKPVKLELTGLLAWEKYKKGDATPFRAFHGDRVVGRIIKRANHSGIEKNTIRSRYSIRSSAVSITTLAVHAPPEKPPFRPSRRR